MSKTWSLCITGLLLWSAGLLHAQELLLDELPPALRDKAIVLQITTKVAENSQETWTAYTSKVTIPGRPVSIKLVGGNCIIEIRFTLNPQQNKFTLAAQSQIWIEIPGKGVSYKTASHSIPMDLGEPILFFPLGSDADPNNPRIELLLTIYRHGEEPADPAGEAAGRDR